MARAASALRRTTSDPTALGREFKVRLHSGNVLLGGMIMEYIRPSLVKLYGQGGFEFIFADNEHVLMSGQPAMADFVLAARDNGLPVIAKTPDLGRTETARLLEAGVVGIQLPRTESRRDLEELIDYVKFPPLGTRAGAPLYGNVDYAWPTDDKQWLHEANESTVIVGHIETRRAYENAEQIISTPNLDMIYVGPYDFSISMGQPGDYDHPDVRGPMEQILELCVQYNIPFGTTVTSPQAAARWIARGARFFYVIDELSLIARGVSEAVEAYRIAIQTVQVVKDHLKKA